MSERVKVSDVLLNIGWQFANDATINSLAKSNFGRPFNVIVGGYAQKLASEDEAPFIWVMSDEEEADISGEGTRSFTAKVVLGICPMKDVPSTTKMFAQATIVNRYCSEIKVLADEALSLISEGDPIRESSASIVTVIDTAEESAATNIASAKESAAEGSWREMLTDIDSLASYAVTIMAKLDELYDIVNDDTHYHVRERVDAALVISESLEITLSILMQEEDSVRTAFEQYEEDPFISKVYAERTDSAAGLVAYGAISMFDAFRDLISKIMNGTNFGLPLVSMSFKSQSVSHYPLDWTEFTAKFERQETLSL